VKELRAIIAEYRKIDFSKQQAALATVVKVRGSSYRSPGARMLITDDGRWVGSISGGCLEGDALRKARMVMTNKNPIAITYDTREESNQNLGIALGCNGIIDVLIEPLDPDDATNFIKLVESITDLNQPFALATIFNSPFCIAEKLLITEGGRVLQSFTQARLTMIIEKDLQQLFRTKKSETKTYIHNNTDVEVFIELIQPVTSLILFGGGFDARPLSQLAKTLGWNVFVTDECVAHIVPKFFPDADKLTLCHREFIDRDIEITPYTACVLMSHNYNYDRDVFKKLLKTQTPYIGILGPRKRFDKMKAELANDQIELTTGDTHRIHSPIGLDIGAETPDEIAVSIVAEIQSKFSNRSGGFLKYRSNPIHQRDGENDQVFKQVYLPESSKSASL
jgi:xanthine/CO dehydrogenase XdhC/CoxF family maturation factor